MADSVALLERPDVATHLSLDRSARRAFWRMDRITLLAVIAAAFMAAGSQYRHFLDVHRTLWDTGSHDRNSHYFFALQLATDLSHGEFLHFFVDLDTARVWPPLHGVLAATALLVGGPDDRLAVLPSLAAYAGCIVLAFLVARRAVPHGRTVAGVTAAAFVAASPSHRAYATDVMLESTGAFLTLVALYWYLRAVQGHALWAGRWLGLALTALFLEKYNYWLLVVLAVAAATVVEYRRQIVAAARRRLGGLDVRGLLRAELRQPLNYLIGGVLVLVAIVMAHGDRPFVLGGKTVSLFPPFNVVHVAYALVFVRLVRWWFTTGRQRVANLPLRARQLIYWHVWPAAVWLLLPKRIGNFLWYLGPWNAPPGWKRDTVAGIADYARWTADEYHPALWSAVTAAVLLGVALAFCRRLRPGATVVLWLVLVGTVLSATHANRKARFLHSWVAAAWVGAGLGLAGLTRGRFTAGRPRLRRGLTAAVPVGLALALGPAALQPGASPEGGPHAGAASLRDLTDYCLDELTPTHRLAFVTTLGVQSLVDMAYLERFGQHDGLEDLWMGFGAVGEENRDGFLRWLRTTDCDTVVVCEALEGEPWGEGFSQRTRHEQIRDLLPAQTMFAPAERREFPRLNAVVTVWRR